jgi:hypothetical protein
VSITNSGILEIGMSLFSVLAHLQLTSLHYFWTTVRKFNLSLGGLPFASIALEALNGPGFKRYATPAVA